ncbi:alpha/beta hydrolase [Enterovibrio nigricans]|nr:alpha/beta hydrolase-fold protein [Enterovibrio nigricans]
MDPVRENLKDRTGCLGALERFSFEAASLKGNLANEDCNRHLIVYLPKSYCESPERDYPIVYVLHGMDGTPESWFSLIPTDPSLDRIMDTLVQNGDVEEMILVAVDGSTSLLGSWYLNSPVSGNFFDLLTQETIDIVESKYRVKAGSRAIFGHSMGGFGALYAAMYRPDLYQACAALSPAGMMMRQHAYQQHADFFQQEVDKMTRGEECEWFVYAYLSILRAIVPDENNPPSYITQNMDRAMEALERFHLSAIAEERAPILKTQPKYAEIGDSVVGDVHSLPIYSEIGTNEGESVGDPILESFQMMIAKFEELDLPIKHHVFEGGHIDKVSDQIERGLRFISDEFQK